jgi:hypothetical protein
MAEPIVPLSFSSQPLPPSGNRLAAPSSENAQSANTAPTEPDKVKGVKDAIASLSRTGQLSPGLRWRMGRSVELSTLQCLLIFLGTKWLLEYLNESNVDALTTAYTDMIHLAPNGKVYVRNIISHKGNKICQWTHADVCLEQKLAPNGQLFRRRTLSFHERGSFIELVRKMDPSVRANASGVTIRRWSRALRRDEVAIARFQDGYRINWSDIKIGPLIKNGTIYKNIICIYLPLPAKNISVSWELVEGNGNVGRLTNPPAETQSILMPDTGTFQFFGSPRN